MEHETIGQYRIERRLSEAGGVAVCLGVDREAQRRVVVRRFAPWLLENPAARSRFDALTAQLRRIQHPNIAALIDAGTQRHGRYLVHAQVDGKTLAELIRERRWDPVAALELFQGIVEGVEAAHFGGVFQLDLAPLAVRVGSHGIPQIIDFGLAPLMRLIDPNPRAPFLHHGYQAPEVIEGRATGAAADLFALGLVLDEMLTGMPVFSGGDVAAIHRHILADPIAPPSQFDDRVDERLDRIVLRAVEKDPRNRFASADELLQAVRGYRGLDDEGAQAHGGTIARVLRRMERNSDFPAMSHSIQNLNAMSEVDDKDMNHLAGVILRDYALTNKILKVVNSAYYGALSGRINTISRAVVILGIEAIRSIAASLIFFESLQSRAQAESLKQRISQALFTGMLAGRLVDARRGERVEEFFLCGMLHELGRILVAFYLPDREQEIMRLIDEGGGDQADAELRVLGTRCEEIGLAVARQWNFPKAIVETMAHDRSDGGRAPQSATERRRLIASFATEATHLLTDSTSADGASVERLLARYRNGVQLTPKRLGEVVTAAGLEFKVIGKVLAPASAQLFLDRLARAVATRVGGGAASAPMAASGSTEGADASAAVAIPERDESSGDAEAILSESLQEVTAILVGGGNLSELFNVVLETFYRAMGFDRVALALRDRRGEQLVARLGFGDGLDRLLRNFRLPLHYAPDVFHASLKNNVDVYVSDARADSIRGDIPDWHDRATTARAFVIFPLVVKGRVFGLIYGERGEPDSIDLGGQRLNLLRALRNQLVLALKSR